jgi:hypothetical protein
MFLVHKHNHKLPEEFRKYFWDVAFDELTFDKYPRFIAERLLNFGNLDDIKWLLARTDRQFLDSLVETSRNLNDKTKNYWQIILKHPTESPSENE